MHNYTPDNSRNPHNFKVIHQNKLYRDGYFFVHSGQSAYFIATHLSDTNMIECRLLVENITRPGLDLVEFRRSIVYPRYNVFSWDCAHEHAGEFPMGEMFYFLSQQEKRHE